MNNPVQIAVIGCGDVAAQRHLPAIVANPDARLIAVCDTDLKRAQDARDRFGSHYATDSADLILSDSSIDAVIVATPPWVTPVLTIAALNHGKDVLAEKPMALDVSMAARVVTTEAASDRFVQVGFVMRHGPMFGTLYRWIEEGALGSPLIYRIGIFDEVYDPVGAPEHLARMLATLGHGPPFVHEGAHTMDHLHYLTGSRASTITAWGVKTRNAFAAPNFNSATVTFLSGDTARVEIGWLYPAPPTFEWSILGPNGVASFDLGSQTVTLNTDTRDEHVSVEGNEDWFESCFRIQLETFIEGIRTRRPTGPSAKDGYDSLVLCRAIADGLDSPFISRKVSYA